MNGRLGAWSLLANVPQSVAQCPTDDFSTVIISVCNQNNVKAKIRLALTVEESDMSTATNGFLEYDVELDAKGVIERTSIVVPAGWYVTAQADIDRVSVVVWGVSVGSAASISDIVPNVFYAPQVTVVASNSAAVNIPLGVTTYEGSPVTYSQNSGTLPSGVTATSGGVLTGLASIAGYDPAGETTPVTFQANFGAVVKTQIIEVTKKWADGSSTAFAAADASEIVEITGGTALSGTYYINLPNEGTKLIYCDMTTDGGGWMMLGYAGSTAGVGDTVQFMFDQIGEVQQLRALNQISFSRFDEARSMTAGDADSQVMWRRTNDTNVIMIHSINEMWNRIPGGANAGNRDLNGGGAGYPITTMKLSQSGPAGLEVKTNGRYESGPSYPGIAWNSAYNDNTDGAGSFSTYLNRRSLIYWETNGVQSAYTQGQWFHGDPLQMGPSRGPGYGVIKKDIELYFRTYVPTY